MSDEPQTSIDDEIEAIRRYISQHEQLGRIIRDTTDTHSPLSLFALGALNRSASMVSGFLKLVEAENYVCAHPLVRLQIDTAMRLNAFKLVDYPQHIANKIIQGAKFSNFQDRDGTQLRDVHLRQVLQEEDDNQWIECTYKHTSDNVHFSRSAVLLASQLRENNKIEFNITDSQNYIEDEIKINIITGMNAGTGIALKKIDEIHQLAQSL